MSKVIVHFGENSITTEQFGFPTHTYELVTEVPHGYFVWNIGSWNMAEGYLPLCRWASQQRYAGGIDIDVDSLKAIKIEGAGKILDAVGGGQNTVKAMERYIKQYRNAKPGTWSYAQVRRIKEALPIMRKIKGLEG